MVTFDGSITTKPVKSFFVDMLTKDIDTQDAILDMLDNSVDGIQRTSNPASLNKKDPYKNFYAKIEIGKDKFVIKDNCGGIPWKLHDYAFRMGRANRKIDSGIHTVGTYGIGMKRAIFKIGQECIITSHAKDMSYQVLMSSEWMKDEDNWELLADKVPADRTKGTTIEVSPLNPAISTEFSCKTFMKNFKEAIATNYAYIISKGFKVYVNNEEVKPKSLRLLFSGVDHKNFKNTKIEPYIYKTEYKGVNVFLSVGFSPQAIPSVDDIQNSLENYGEKYSSADAGWTVICNDRTVLYCDKTYRTVWGVSGVPQYHTQFVAVSGIVVFTSKDASLLPMNTTKRGVDMSSEIYMHVRDKMIEGTKIFTAYTNKWKGSDLVAESRKAFKETKDASLDEVIEGVRKVKMAPTKGAVPGMQYKPKLPMPRPKDRRRKIVFQRNEEQIKVVAEYLLGDSNANINKVGEKCFDLMLEEAGE